jgi:hypothetical protein
VAEKPTALSATSGSAASDAKQYAGDFTHTFTGKSGDATKMESAVVDEKFASTKAASPFGEFSADVNAANKGGWELDAAGQMVKPDHVSIDRHMVDARKFVKSASNPSPAGTLPQSFTMDQNLHAKTFPSGKLDGAAFTTAKHVRALEEQSGTLAVVISAGQGSVTLDYEGPAVYRNAKASPAKVVASPPKPKDKDATWDRTEVTVTADVLPSTTTIVYSLVGPKLGCEIDASSGVVKIGDKAGTIKVRASDGTATSHFDEVSIEITERPAEKPEGKQAEGGGAASSFAEPEE